MSETELIISIAGMFTGVVVMAFVSFALVKVFRGPIGQAIARRINHRSGELDPDLANEVASLRGELEQMHQRLTDAEERIDFSERLLVKKQESAADRGT
jgi:hypothetical protein